jgi:hypothetical protein
MNNQVVDAIMLIISHPMTHTQPKVFITCSLTQRQRKSRNYQSFVEICMILFLFDSHNTIKHHNIRFTHESCIDTAQMVVITILKSQHVVVWNHINSIETILQSTRTLIHVLLCCHPMIPLCQIYWTFNDFDDISNLLWTNNIIGGQPYYSFHKFA